MSTAAPLQNTAAKSPLVSKASHAGLSLQRKCACGGSAATSLTGECEECNSKRLQKKLSIGASNDPLEQEADRVADQVLAAPAHSAVSATPPHIQRFTGQSTEDAGTAPASVDNVLASSGRPLDPALQLVMGQRFGYDFSRVRVHSGGTAEQSALQVKAHAYTVGHNVVFGVGRFSPESQEGQRLLAHELTHVMQQSDSDGSGVAHSNGKRGLFPILRMQPKLVIGEPNDKYEQEADRVADQIIRMPEPQRQMEPEEEKRMPVQKKSGTGKEPQASSCLEVKIDPLGDGGQPLSELERKFFEPRFGHDFSRVRLHTGPEADELNNDLHSHAFTHGQHIWLGRGETTSNLPLLAHELAHTIQQGAVLPLEGQLRMGALAAGVTLSTSHTRPTGIQRSVQETGVSSPESVLGRIGRTLKKHKWSFIPLKLYYLGVEFDPGKGVDLPSNAFVYTCRGGWIDMGHFFFAAAGATVNAHEAWKWSIETEQKQQRERKEIERMSASKRKQYIGGSWAEAKAETKAGKSKKESRRGEAWSAWTIEDVPSDVHGIYFGRSLLRLGSPEPDISKEMEKFFVKWGGVDASRNKGLLRKMMIETLGSADPEKLPRQHKKYPFYPVLLTSARELCGPR